MSMETDGYKLLLSIKDVVEKNKSLNATICKVKFNQNVQSSIVPFRHNLVFNLTPQDSSKSIELRFERDSKEFAKTSIKLEPHYFTRRLDTEKWIEVETQDTNSKIYTKLAFSIMKTVVENKVKTPAKYNNYIDTSKSYEASPRLNHLTTKNSSISTQPLLTQPDEIDIEPLNSFRKRSSTNIGTISSNSKLPPSGSQNTHKDSTNKILSKYPELKLNLKKALKNVDEVTPSKELTWKSKSSKPNSSKGSKGSKRSKGEPLTYRGSDDQERLQPPRRTKSVEKIKDQPTQVDEEEHEKTREYENKFSFEPKASEDLQIEIDVLSLENKELKQIREKFESLEIEKKLKEDIEKYFHHVLRETNNRLNKENKKFLYLLGSIENLKERYETENRRCLEQIEFFSGKYSEAEKEVEELREELTALKSKGAMIKFMENETKNLKSLLSAQENRNIEIEKAIIKKEAEFDNVLKEIEKENKRAREEIKKLEDQVHELKRERSQFKMDKEAAQQENNILKARIASLEMNGEFVKQMGSQRESLIKEISILNEANEKLKESLTKTKRIESSGETQKNFVDAVEVVKKRVDFVNFQAVSCLQNVKTHFDLNFDLRNNIEEIENFLGLDAIEVLRLDTESDEPIEETPEDFEGELERNITMVGAFSDNNKKLEICIYNDKVPDTDSSVLEKQKSFDFYSSAGSLKNSQSSSQLTKVRSEKSMEYKKPTYIAVKDDLIDQRLSEFINNHRDSRKLLCLFKRRSNGMYMFGSKKVYLKLENSKLHVKAGQLQLPIDKFVSLNLELEVDRAGADGSRFKKGK